jgi:uncharacterized membrane protein YagU involved in acid resistance
VSEQNDGPSPGELAHAGLRGVIAAMAMSGMRAGTKSLGLVEQSPPQAILRQRARFFLWSVPRKRRRALEELTHWSYGAVGGVIYGALPDSVRRRAWSGPLYGLGLWLSFELGLSPLLGLKQARELRTLERGALAADHLLYGLVLSETRSRPRE